MSDWGSPFAQLARQVNLRLNLAELLHQAFRVEHPLLNSFIIRNGCDSGFSHFLRVLAPNRMSLLHRILLESLAWRWPRWWVLLHDVGLATIRGALLVHTRADRKPSWGIQGGRCHVLHCSAHTSLLQCWIVLFVGLGGDHEGLTLEGDLLCALAYHLDWVRAGFLYQRRLECGWDRAHLLPAWRHKALFHYWVAGGRRCLKWFCCASRFTSGLLSELLLIGGGGWRIWLLTWFHFAKESNLYFMKATKLKTTNFSKPVILAA